MLPEEYGGSCGTMASLQGKPSISVPDIIRAYREEAKNLIGVDHNSKDIK